MKCTQQELKFRLEDIENVLANQRLEGLEPDPRAIEDLRSVARDEMKIEEVIKRIYERMTLEKTDQE